jgi:beta-lactamase class A
MTHRITRRTLVLAGLPALLPITAFAAADERANITATLAAIETRTGGKIGVYALDTHTGRDISFNGDKRFAMCSTFKVLLAAAILARVDADALRLGDIVRFGPADMLPHAPITSKHLAEGAISVRGLCEATVTQSDNPAANLLLPRVGGPAGLTRFLRVHGDDITRLDRNEMALNSNLPGDLRDTTTARAMTRTMVRLLTTDALSPASREQLAAWLVAASTGLTRLRAGLPAAWKAGDKTGTGSNGAINDVAVAWPPGRSPIFLSVYMTGSTLTSAKLNEAHADIARCIAGAMVQG